MHLRNGEVITKIIKRHRTPFFFKMAKVLLVTIPVYIGLVILKNEMGSWMFVILLCLVSVFVGIIILQISFDFLLDKLVITNRRVVWVDWKSLFKRSEHEAELIDVQDIETRETGILSKLHFFDYGLLEVETAASKTCIVFTDCPNPEGTKHFILGQMEKDRKRVHEKRENTGEHEEWSVN